MDVESCDSSRSRVEVLIGAPASKIDAQVMERDGNVADSVGEVEGDEATLRRVSGQVFDG